MLFARFKENAKWCTIDYDVINNICFLFGNILTSEVQLILGEINKNYYDIKTVVLVHLEELLHMLKGRIISYAW